MDSREDIPVPDTQVPEVQSEQPTSVVTADELLNGTQVLTDENQQSEQQNQQKEQKEHESQNKSEETPETEPELTDKVTQAKEHSVEVINNSTKEF